MDSSTNNPAIQDRQELIHQLDKFTTRLQKEDEKVKLVKKLNSSFSPFFGKFS